MSGDEKEKRRTSGDEEEKRRTSGEEEEKRTSRDEEKKWRTSGDKKEEKKKDVWRRGGKKKDVWGRGGQIYVEEKPVSNSEKLSYEKGNLKLCSCRLFVKKMNCPKYISPVLALVEIFYYILYNIFIYHDLNIFHRCSL